ncbi:hypothetical protein MMT79_27775, partial [Escherichia coli]|nr:hypothetical protein [Escherichia coli]
LPVRFTLAETDGVTRVMITKLTD